MSFSLTLNDKFLTNNSNLLLLVPFFLVLNKFYVLEESEKFI